MSLRVIIAGKSLSEKAYTCSVLFETILEQKVEIQVTDDLEHKFYRIILDNLYIIDVADIGLRATDETTPFPKFFLPRVSWMRIPNIVENNEYWLPKHKSIPYYWGKPSIQRKSDNHFYLETDIVASAFAFLANLDEYNSRLRDQHGRFLAESSTAFNESFLCRPVVMEYAQFLAGLFEHMGHALSPVKRKTTVRATHDIDSPKKFARWDDGLREILGDLGKRRSPRLFLKNSIAKMTVHLGLRSDPFWTFERLSSDIKRRSASATYYVLAEGRNKNEKNYSNYSKYIRNLIQKLIEDGHHIGMHGSYHSSQDLQLVAREKTELEDCFQVTIQEARQHYLRVDPFTTFDLLEQVRVRFDSSMGFADHPGFRQGMCVAFPLYSLKKRKVLEVWEKPLILMEGSLETYQKLSPSKSIDLINQLMSEVRFYRGEFVFLWHNSSFHVPRWEQYLPVYNHLLTLYEQA